MLDHLRKNLGSTLLGLTLATPAFLHSPTRAAANPLEGMDAPGIRAAALQPNPVKSIDLLRDESPEAIKTREKVFSTHYKLFVEGPSALKEIDSDVYEVVKKQSGKTDEQLKEMNLTWARRTGNDKVKDGYDEFVYKALAGLDSVGKLVEGKKCLEIQKYSEIVAQFDRIVRDGFGKEIPIKPWDNNVVQEIVKASSEAARTAGIDKLPKLSEDDRGLNQESLPVAIKVAQALDQCFKTKFKEPEYKIDEALLGEYIRGAAANTVFWYLRRSNKEGAKDKRSTT